MSRARLAAIVSSHRVNPGLECFRICPSCSEIRCRHRDQVQGNNCKKSNNKEIAHLTIKAGTDTFDLYLCPKSFMDDMGVSFAKGDEVAFTGSKVKLGEAEMILAREVVKGTDTLVLRDAKGVPVWNWRK